MKGAFRPKVRLTGNAADKSTGDSVQSQPGALHQNP